MKNPALGIASTLPITPNRRSIMASENEGADKASRPVIELVCFSRDEPSAISLLIHAMLLQTARNWRLTVLSPDYDRRVTDLVRSFSSYEPRIRLLTGPEDLDLDGHALWNWYVARSNASHLLFAESPAYYMPRFVELVSAAIVQSDADVILFNRLGPSTSEEGMPFSYHGHDTRYEAEGRDLASTVFRRTDVQDIGFRLSGKEGASAFFDDLIDVRGNMTACKIDEFLMVHF